jgi:hypothetical protein
VKEALHQSLKHPVKGAFQHKLNSPREGGDQTKTNEFFPSRGSHFQETKAQPEGQALGSAVRSTGQPWVSVSRAMMLP